MIKGEESLFFIKRGEAYVPVACLTSNNLSESAETLATTTRENSGWRTAIPTMQEYTIEISGVMMKDDADSGNGGFSYRQLRKMKRDRTLIEWRIVVMGGYYGDFGRGYITSISDSNEAGEMITFSATLLGYGTPHEDDTNYDIPIDNTPAPQVVSGGFTDITDKY